MIDLKIATPTESLFNDKCNQVEVKTIDGNVTILPNHIPLLSIIKNGYIIIDRNKKIEVDSGSLSVGENSKVNILITKIKE